jgi:acyl-coenzyme A synthetase/AMP-(fatty) acid ligase
MFEEAARQHPDAPVRLDRPLSVVDSDRTTYTYRELADIVDDLATRLAEAGVGPGEYVPVYKSVNFDVPLLACAAARAGAIPVMLSPALDPSLVLLLLSRLSSRRIVTDTVKLTALTGAGMSPDTRAIFTEALATRSGAPRRAPVDLPADRPALITHSSGTTGVPKLMVHTARTLGYRLWPQQLLGWPVRRRPPVLLAMSFVHSRFFNSLGVFLGYGNPIAVVSDSDLDTARRMLTATRPALVETHPNNFVLWEDFADEPDGPLRSVRYYSVTFDAIHPGTVKKLLSASTHRRPVLLQLFGQSETGPLTGWLSTNGNVERGDGRCIGYALPGFTRVRVVDPRGRRVPRGTIGRLEVRSRGRVRTYLGEDERFRAELTDGWWYVGDMGWRDRRGRVYLADREVDKISEIDSNLQLEDLLMDRLNEISELVIVPNGAGRPTPILATRHDCPLDRARWAAAVAGLPDLEAPIQWRFADFPRTSTWKIRRLEIRELLGTPAEPVAVTTDSPR